MFMGLHTVVLDIQDNGQCVPLYSMHIIYNID